MKKIAKHLVSLCLLFLLILPFVASAQIEPMKELDRATNLRTLGTGGEGGIVTTIDRIITIALGFLGLLFVIWVLYAGFLWMTAAGDDGKVKKARTMIIEATIGVVIILAAYAITSFIISNIRTATTG